MTPLPHNEDDQIGRWSLEKLELLRKYLSAYIKIVSKQTWCSGYEYIDAFAGTGRPKSREEQHYVDGSPRIALGLNPPFTTYWFVEQSIWRADKLSSLQKEFSDRNINICLGDCNQIIKETILPTLGYQMRKRAIAFLDPFGMQLVWKTMELVAKSKTIEIMLNFPVMAINRAVLRKRDDLISETQRKRLNEFWGTDDWTMELYQEEETLFGKERVKKLLSGKEMGRIFRKRLAQIFPFCTDPVLM